MAWKIPGPIAPGATVTLTYTAKRRLVGQLHTGQTAVNTARRPSTSASPRPSATNPLDLPRVRQQQRLGDPQVRVPRDHGHQDHDRPRASRTSPTPTSSSPSAGASSSRTTPTWPRHSTRSSTTPCRPPGPTTPDRPRSPVRPRLSRRSSPNAAGDKLTWNFAGQTINPGASVVITFTATPQLAARANPNPPDQRLGRRLEGFEWQPRQRSTVRTRTRTTPRRRSSSRSPTWSSTRRPRPRSSRNEEFDYGITVKNKGPNVATNVVINDPLPRRPDLRVIGRLQLRDRLQPRHDQRRARPSP